MNSFLITSAGRTGTRFLSRFMNHSKLWRVGHQPDKRDSIKEDKVKSEKEFYDVIIPEYQQARFNQDHYGEVNGALRYNFLNIQATKKGIIYRNPEDIILSYANGNDVRNTLPGLINKVKDVNLCHNVFHKILSDHPEIVLIDFVQMTTSRQYLFDVLKRFGIEDVAILNSRFKRKVNSNGKQKYETYDKLPKEITQLVNTMNWKEYKYITNKL